MRISYDDYIENYQNENTAFLGIDLQNDFGNPKGSLYVKGGEELAIIAGNIISEFGGELIYWTRDYHPANHCSFKVNGGNWPRHCIKGTWGAKFLENLAIDPKDEFVMKGVYTHVDSYSGFFDNQKEKQTELDEILKGQYITQLFVMGLATDYCVKFTVLDAIELGYKVFVYLPGCRAVNITPGDGEKAVKEMEDAGAIIIEE
jgi:nicotinamidase/pyrazinamidase